MTSPVPEDVDDWTAPGPHPVAPGVHRIPLPLPNDGLLAVNVYAIADGDRVVLVDGGWALADGERALQVALDRLGYGLGDISRFLVTHAHRDHYTQAVALRERFGSSVSLGEGERPTLAAINGPAGFTELAQLAQLAAGGAEHLARVIAAQPHPVPDRAHWQLPDRWLPDGARVELGGRTLEAVHTPGHTRGHLVYHDPASLLLFAGDHVLPHITPSIGFEQCPVASPLSDYLTSLQLVRDMPDALLLPAHGPATHSVHVRVDQLLLHHEWRLEASLSALQSGAATAFDVAERLTWTRRHRSLDDLDPFNQMLAVLESSAHLEVLTERGHVRRADVDGRVHYTAAG